MEEEVKLFEIMKLQAEQEECIRNQLSAKEIESDLRDAIKKIDEFISSLQIGYKSREAYEMENLANIQKGIISDQITALQEIYDSETAKLGSINFRISVLDPTGKLRAKTYGRGLG